MLLKNSVAGGPYILQTDTCEDITTADCTGVPPCISGGHSEAYFERGDVDNEGHLLFLNVTTIAGCAPGYPLGRVELWQWLGSGKRLLGFINSRCAPALSSLDFIDDYKTVHFDRTNGKLLVPLLRGCRYYAGGATCNYQDLSWVVGISGFSTTFEILQTYTPQPALGFRVPYMPDGLPAADHFDTYWGPLAHPLDFTQAHPLQCGYPAAAPHVGDYLTVTDTVPTPAPGQGVYYVTAATYQGATRYGRKTTAGHMSGRDPAGLPACKP